MLDILAGEHLAHIRPTGGVADHGRTAADQRDRLVARHLQALHQGKRHEMSRCKAVSGAVKADIKNRFAIVDHGSDFFFIGDLRDQSALNKFLINTHGIIPLLFLPL